MDLITQAISHQKQSLSAVDAPNLAENNDILSALGQEPLHQALKNQDIQPEQNMIRIDDITQES